MIALAKYREKEKNLKSFLSLTFPTMLRFERKKTSLEKSLPLLTAGMAVLYFLYSVFVSKSGLGSGGWLAAKKALMLYTGFLLMIELSPDSQNLYKKSFFAMALALFLTGDSSASSGLYFLFVIRLLTKSSGYLTTIQELAAMTLYTMLMFIMSGFIYPMMLAIVLILDYKFKHKDNRNLPFAAVNFLLGLVWFKNPFGIMTRDLDLFASLAVLVISLIYIFRLSILKNILSFNDIGNNLISPRRIKASGIIMILSLILMALGYGQVYRYIHLWVLLLCISVPYVRDIKRLFKNQADL